MWVASSAAAVAVEGTRQPGECGEKKKSRKKRKKNQQNIKTKRKQKTNKQKNNQKKTKNKRTEMRTQEQKQHDENGKYIHKCMKQNHNREETEGEEPDSTRRRRGGSAGEKVALVARGRATGFQKLLLVWSLFIDTLPACKGGLTLWAGGAARYLTAWGIS